MDDLILHIGNKTYSSWSMRPWVMMRQAEIPFREVLHALYTPQWDEAQTALSPSLLVPTLVHGERVVWESLAILDYLAEIYPAKRLWPFDMDARALARSVSAEMHGSFQALRQHLPMNLKRNRPRRGALPEAVTRDIARIEALWALCRKRFGDGGPYLFGREFTIADAMFAPVCARFDSYQIDIGDAACAYVVAVLHADGVREWYADAITENAVIAAYEQD